MFDSRKEAGRLLAEELIKRHIQADLILGIPRGGVVVAAAVAQFLKVPLDVLVVKKLGAPGNPELAIGAIAADDVTYIDHRLAKSVGADEAFLTQEVRSKHHELTQREQVLRRGKEPLSVAQKKVILVDDGVATGATVLAALEWLKKHRCGRTTLAIPVAAKETAEMLRTLVDTCIVLEQPWSFGAVGQFYQNFAQVTDKEAVELLKNSKFEARNSK